jgi:arsenate reductase
MTVMTKVLFACAENKKRSQLAEAIFNHLSDGPVATSAGTFPATDIDPLTFQVLKEVGIDGQKLSTKLLDDDTLNGADLIVSFGCLVPSQFPADKFQEWHIEDPETIEQFRAVRDILTSKIQILLQNLPK